MTIPIKLYKIKITKNCMNIFPPDYSIAYVSTCTHRACIVHNMSEYIVSESIRQQAASCPSIQANK